MGCLCGLLSLARYIGKAIIIITWALLLTHLLSQAETVGKTQPLLAAGKTAVQKQQLVLAATACCRYPNCFVLSNFKQTLKVHSTALKAPWQNVNHPRILYDSVEALPPGGYFSHAEAANNTEFTKNDYIQEIYETLKRASTKELPVNKLMRKYFPELQGATQQPSMASKQQQSVLNLLNSIKTVEQWLQHSAKIILSESLHWSMHPQRRFNLSSALKSPMVRRDLIYSHASPFIDNISWDPVGIRDVEDANLEEAELEKITELLDTALQSVPMVNETVGNFSNWSLLPKDFPVSMRELWKEFQASNESDCKRRFAAKPINLLRKAQKALFDVYEYFEKQFEESRDFLNHSSFYKDSLFDDDLYPITPALEIGNLDRLEADELEVLGDLIAKKTAEVGSVKEMKEVLKTTEWRKNSSIAKHDENLAGFTYEDFDKALAEHPLLLDARPGELVMGKVVYVAQRFAMVDINAKAVATLSSSEAFLYGADPPKKGMKALLRPGDTAYFEILYATETDIRLTLRACYKFYAWQKILEWSQADATFYGKVIQINQGGAIVSVLGVEAFLPNSQIVGFEDFSSSMIGKKLPLKILQLDLNNNKLVISNRRAEVEKRMHTVHIGSLINGVVTATKRFGVIVQFGSFSGLLHVKQMSHHHIDNPGALFPVNSKIKAVIFDYNKASGQIYLSTKSLESYQGEITVDKEKVFDMAERTINAQQLRLHTEKVVEAEETEKLFQLLGLNRSSFFSNAPSEVSINKHSFEPKNTTVYVRDEPSRNELVELLFNEKLRGSHEI